MKTGNYPHVTTHVLQEMKVKGEKISMLTAYDFSIALNLIFSPISIIYSPPFPNLPYGLEGPNPCVKCSW